MKYVSSHSIFSIVISSKNADELKFTTETAITKANYWLSANKLLLNWDKTKLVHLKTTLHAESKENLIVRSAIDGKQITEVEVTKFLVLKQIIC